MSTVDHPRGDRQGRTYRLVGGEVPLTAVVAGVVSLDEPYGDMTLSSAQLLAHAHMELEDAQAHGHRVLGSWRGIRAVERDRATAVRMRRARRARTSLRGVA